MLQAVLDRRKECIAFAKAVDELFGTFVKMEVTVHGTEKSRDLAILNAVSRLYEYPPEMMYDTAITPPSRRKPYNFHHLGDQVNVCLCPGPLYTQLTEKLDYVDSYPRADNPQEVFKREWFLDHAPYSFVIAMSKWESGTSERQSAWNPFITLGLIYSGPKTVEEFKQQISTGKIKIEDIGRTVGWSTHS